jgi:TatD DNase family protein
MNLYYVDTHCHLDLIQDIQNNVAKEDSSPVKTITVTNAPGFFKPNNHLFAGCKNIRVGVGLHPELAGQFKQQLVDFPEHLNHTRYVGEIGLDGSARFKNTYDIQHDIFRNILSLLSTHGEKIVTVHSRSAARDVIDLVRDYRSVKNNKIILHWYTGDKSSLMQAVDMGIYFSVNHKMLQSRNGLETLKNIPRKLLLTETDAPFTFDANIKSRMSSLQCTHKLIAKALKQDENEVCGFIYNNFKSLLL